MDDPVRASLLGPHNGFLERHGAVLRYPTDVAPFVTLAADHDESAWDDLAMLFGSGTVVVFAGLPTPPPPHWRIALTIPGVQLVDVGLETRDDPDAEPLGPANVPEMLDLVARTQPGPFLTRTVELGTYLGIRSGGTLIAMAGERLHPPGYTEISAVCTDPAHRGRGLATRLVRAVAAGIRRRGETPFLHASATNDDAIRLYEGLGFTLRRTVDFIGTRVP